MTSTLAPALGLPAWPSDPESVDHTGRSWLIVSCGPREPAAVAERWAAQARPLGAVTVIEVDGLEDSGRDAVRAALADCRTGVRIMVCGNQFDVLTTLALARSYGAGASELRSFVVEDGVIAVYCAHCRDTHRVRADPGGAVDCPGCARHLEVHVHHSALRGSYLASDARARELA